MRCQWAPVIHVVAATKWHGRSEPPKSHDLNAMWFFFHSYAMKNQNKHCIRRPCTWCRPQRRWDNRFLFWGAHFAPKEGSWERFCWRPKIGSERRCARFSWGVTFWDIRSFPEQSRSERALCPLILIKVSAPNSKNWRFAPQKTCTLVSCALSAILADSTRLVL